MTAVGMETNSYIAQTRIMILMVVLVTGTTKNGSETERNYVNFQPLRDHPT